MMSTVCLPRKATVQVRRPEGWLLPPDEHRYYEVNIQDFAVKKTLFAFHSILG